LEVQSPAYVPPDEVRKQPASCCISTPPPPLRDQTSLREAATLHRGDWMVQDSVRGGWGVQPPLNVFNPLVALVYLYLGSDVTPQIAKRSKMLNFRVNTWVFKAQNAPKPVFGRGSAPDPARWGSLRRFPDTLVG